MPFYRLCFCINKDGADWWNRRDKTRLTKMSCGFMFLPKLKIIGATLQAAGNGLPLQPGFVFEGEFDMGFGGFRGFFQTEFDLLGFAQEVAPVAFFVPLAPVQLNGVLDALAAVAALQIVFAAIFVATPADALRIFWENGEFFCHIRCLVFYWMKL